MPCFICLWHLTWKGSWTPLNDGSRSEKNEEPGVCDGTFSAEKGAKSVNEREEFQKEAEYSTDEIFDRYSQQGSDRNIFKEA